MSSDVLEEMNEVKSSQKIIQKMSLKETEQFLTCARVGRLGISLKDGPYIIPVGFGYDNGKIFFHTCYKGLKMYGIRANPNVCFEVDESLSDCSMFKSIIVFGEAEIIEDREEMLPYLQKLINKYRVQVDFAEYMSRMGRDLDKEMNIIRIVTITPRKITNRKIIRSSTDPNFL